MQSLLSVFLVLANMTAGYLLANPPGKYNVTSTTGCLVDYTRSDSFAATPMPRALMLSVFQPAKCTSTVPVAYMPNKTAEYQGPFLKSFFNISADLSPVFLEARLPVCPDQSRDCSLMDDFPILLFSPGYTGPRLLYNVIASAIASEGFIVITIDHPHDASIVTYPDGHAVYNNDSIAENPVDGLQSRAADASFVIDQLSNATAMAELIPRRGSRAFPTDRVAMLGHSLGGASAIVAASQDARIQAAINWDGIVYGSLTPWGLSQPVLIMGAPELSEVTNPNWLAMWPQLKGPKLWVDLQNATHQTFSDAPTLFQAAGQDLTAFEDLLGTIEPAEMVQFLAASTATWMTGALTGKVDGRLGKSPEISTVMKDNF